MNRLLVALLSAFDALLAAAGGLAAALAPLTLLWAVGFGTGADWGALWPTSATVWQFGHLVPIGVELPGEYLAAAGIDPAAGTFALSLAPLGFAVFTALFAARSGARAARAGEPLTGAVAGPVVFAAIAGVVAASGSAPLARVEAWQAVLFPALVYAVPAILASGATAWIVGEGPAGRLRDRIGSAHGGWGDVPGLVVRGSAVSVVGLVAVGALVVAVAVLARGAQIVGLFQAGNVDGIGVVVLALGQLAYVPTLIVWGVSFAAGPGFAVGTGTAVSPAGTQLGVVPGVPVLGAVPDTLSPWLLLLALLPVAVGAVAGWVARSHVAARHPDHEAYGPRLALVGGITVVTAAVTALLALCARGGIGPGRLVDVGPEPGPVAFAVGIEVAIGAAILLLSPRRATRPRDEDRAEPLPVPFDDRDVHTAASRPLRDLAPLPTLPVHAFAGGTDAAAGRDADGPDAHADADDPADWPGAIVGDLDETGPLPFGAGFADTSPTETDGARTGKRGDPSLD
ncbi:DUF6350 family protein [Microbacterium sp. 10M-3C3]|uniref:cell division protein PerM n=1 Tax=Microbacterium sp. 10M-3C3 TaxID=2483401 RepID=UPI00197C4917|nr:DUF6350 family protein [Microbacterium sp. 10M-3C3]